MPYEFGLKSRQRLEECHPDLIKIHEVAIQLTPIDYGIAEGARSLERARDLFAQGKTTLDPDNGQISKHVITSARPHSWATDIYIYHPDIKMRKQLAYDVPSLCHVAGVIIAAAKIALGAGEITHGVRFGGNWDGDGIIITDQDFDDLYHFELMELRS